MSRRHRMRSAAAPAPLNDIAAARARADAAIQSAATPPSPEERVIDLERRLDRWVNYATGLGTLEDKTRAASFEPPWRLSDVEITALASGNDLAAKCICKRPDEMFRRGYAVEGQKPGELDKGKVDELSAYATEDLLADTRLHEGMQYGREYGGALCIMGINDGRPMDQPVDEDNIQSIDFINTIDRRFAYAQSYYSNLGEPGLGNVESYLVSNGVATSSYRSSDGTKFGYRKRSPDQIKRATPGSSSLTVHESRVIRFDGIVADLITRQTLAGWSWSVLQLPFETLRMCDGAFDALAYLISDASQGVLKLKGLFAAISGGKERNLQQRLDTMDRLKSVMHTIALDADGQESFERTTTSFAGIAESIDRIMQRLAAAMDMPVTELFGISPAGLNATGEGDRIKWYDTIATEQTKFLAPKLKRLYRLISLAEDGPFKGKGADFKIKFHPLYAPTDDELAKTRLTNAQRDKIYTDSEIVTPQQVALTLTDVYPSINADEIEEAIENKVKFDPLENDPNEADDVQAKIAAKAAAKPAAPSPFGPHVPPVAGAATKPGVAKAGPASARESTPAKAQAPSGTGQPTAKKTGTKDRLDYSEDQPRASNGQFGEGGGGGAAHAPLFSDKERGLSEDIHQAATDKASLYESAAKGHEEQLDLLNRGTGLDKTLGATVVRGDKGEKPDPDVKGTVIHIAPLKGAERAAQKVATEYDGKWSRVGDVVRSTIAVDSASDVPKVIAALRSQGMELARAPLDRMSKPTEAGYRDIKLNVRYPSGHVGEIQINVKAMVAAKEGEGHKLYEATRSIEAQAKGRDLTRDEAHAVNEANDKAHALYSAAWERSGGAVTHVREAPAAEFKSQFDTAFKDSPFTNHVTHYSEADLSAKGMRTFLSTDGTAGVAVHDHGDGRIEATALFNHGGSKGAGLDVLRSAIRQGGANYVECYGPKLQTLYAKLGFQVESSSPFNHEYAAPGWDAKQFDSPNYYTMRRP